MRNCSAERPASGYRASRDQHHYRVIQSLRETIGAKADLLTTLDTFRKKRNITGYERVGAMSEKDAAEMRQLAIVVRDGVTDWIRKNHPELMSGIRLF